MMRTTTCTFLILALVAALMTTGAAYGMQDANLRARTNAPIAVRGSVMLIPVERIDDDLPWPQRLDVFYEELGVAAPAQLVWICPGTHSAARGWTADPRRRIIRAVAPDRIDQLPEGASPLLALPVPAEGTGSLRIGERLLQPIWLDRAAWQREDVIVPPAIVDRGRTDSSDRADVASAFEFWRGVLQARRGDHPMPGLDGLDPATRAVAVHVTDLWLAGLQRLHDADAALHERIVRILTSRCADGAHQVAAWVADPDRTDALLALLLDTAADTETFVAAVDSWHADIDPLLIIPLRRYDRSVDVMVMHRGDTDHTITARWQGFEDDACQPVIVRPGEVVHLQTMRPESEAELRLGPAGTGTGREPLLDIFADDTGIARVAPATATLIATPPGIIASSMHPTLTLADVERSAQQRTSPAVSSHMHLRKRAGRWEVFLDCRRPPSLTTGGPDLPQSIESLDDVRSHEAVTIIVDAADGVRRRLVIPERGWWSCNGPENATLQIHRRSWEDRWYVRVVLPDAWLTSNAMGQWLHLGLARSHAGTDAIETLPERVVPWNIDPGIMTVNLSQWSDRPTGE